MTQAAEPTPLTPHELADCFRRLALLTNDEELAERMRRHADETEQDSTAAPTRSRLMDPSAAPRG